MSNYKYYLSLCLCIKNEVKYIEDFINHYLKQGVEHFYIINNNSQDNLEEEIEKKGFNNLITLIRDDRPMNIFNCYNEYNGLNTFYNNNLYYLIKKETEWAFVVDIDEYMFGKNGHTIKTYLYTLDQNIGCVYVIWNIINPLKVDGKVTKEFSIKTNLKRLNYDLIHELSYSIKNANDFGKSLFKTSMLFDDKRINLHKIQVTGLTINNYGENKNEWYDNGNQIDYSEENFKNLNITLNHYVIRNNNDYEKKMNDIKINDDQRNSFLNGIMEMLDLDDKYLIEDNTINI
jgi:hypothetical protein